MGALFTWGGLMTTILDIANRALAAVGARSGAAGSTSYLKSLSDGSNEAAQLNLIFNSTRDDLLRGAHWNFARKTAILTLLKSAPWTPEAQAAGISAQSAWSTSFPPPPWSYSYAYPSDCLLVRQLQTQAFYGTGTAYGYPGYAGSVSLGGPRARIMFAVGTDTNTSGANINVVMSDVQNGLGVYTAQISDPNLWDPSFQQCMVSSLAARLAVPLVGSPQMHQALLQEAQMYVIAARTANANEATSNVNTVPDWIAARGDGAGGYFGGMDTPFVAPWDAIGWMGI